MNKGIQKIFSEVPDTYELVNHVLTFFMDIFWRRKMARMAARHGGTKWVDMCSGTGETAVLLSNFTSGGVQVFAADFSLPMLSKAQKKPEGKKIQFVSSDIGQLPFNNNSFDLITLSFATRNLNLSRDILIRNFHGFYRLLKQGGHFFNLETSQPSIPAIKKLFHLYIALFVKPIGSLISGSNAGYAYLSRTIPTFYSAGELSKIMESAGFKEVRYRKLLFGIAAIHQGCKS